MYFASTRFITGFVVLVTLYVHFECAIKSCSHLSVCCLLARLMRIVASNLALSFPDWYSFNSSIIYVYSLDGGSTGFNELGHSSANKACSSSLVHLDRFFLLGGMKSDMLLLNVSLMHGPCMCSVDCA